MELDYFSPYLSYTFYTFKIKGTVSTNYINKSRSSNPFFEELRGTNTNKSYLMKQNSTVLKLKMKKVVSTYIMRSQSTLNSRQNFSLVRTVAILSYYTKLRLEIYIQCWSHTLTKKKRSAVAALTPCGGGGAAQWRPTSCYCCWRIQTNVTKTNIAILLPRTHGRTRQAGQRPPPRLSCSWPLPQPILEADQNSCNLLGLSRDL